MTVDRKSRARKDFRDYQFILQELERLLKMSPAELFTYFGQHREDAFYTLPRANGGDLSFTKKGETHFQEIAIRGLEALGAAGRKHFPPTVVDALKSEFMSEGTEDPPLSEDNAHEVFDTAIANVETEFRQLTHFVPCSIVIHQEPPRFKIGPVEFVLRDLFFKENQAALLRSQESATGFEWGYEELRKFFNRFFWVASVTVDAADKKISRDRACKAIQMALDVLKLFIGTARAAGIRQGYDHGMPRETASLVSVEAGKFSLSLGRSLHDAVLMDHWYDTISKSEPWRLADSVVTAFLTRWDDLPEPYQRFMDGLRWHGEGVSDPEPQSRLVKFWIAIERVVSLRSRDNVTRKAAMLSAKGAFDFADQCRKCEQLYTKRSSVVHGSARRDTERSKTVALEIENLSRTVLCSYLYLLQNLQTNGQCTRKGLEAEFELLGETISKNARQHNNP